MALSWLSVPLGLALITVTLLDVFLTVLHVQVESPFSNSVHRGLWRFLLAGSRPLSPGLRDEVLAWGAPLMVGGIVAFWSTVYILGFALLYLPHIHDPAVFSVKEGASISPLGDALYFSAVSFFTIGYGDVVGTHSLARLLGVFEGASGLLTISLGVTYLLSVYPLISRKSALAVSLNQETAGRADGLAVAQRYVAAGRFDALGDRLRWLNDELLYLGQAHGFYPVLYYVRPRDVHASFVRILAIVQGLVATLRYGLDPVAHREVVSDPRLNILEEGLLYTLHALAESSHLAPHTGVPDEAIFRAEFATLLEGLAWRGLTPLRIDDRAAAERYAQFRIATDRYINAYAQNVGYCLESVGAVYSRWARDSALVGHVDVEQQEGILS